MNYVKIIERDFGNGPGVRVSLFVSGCSNYCKGCFNQEAWDPNYGQPFTDETIKEILELVDHPSCSGLSILGGDPMESYNLQGIEKLIVAFRRRFGFEKTIWLWTGRILEEMMNDYWRINILRAIDVLVDGPFKIKEKDLRLTFRGSKNQRIIDMQATQTFNQLILIEKYMDS